MRWLQARGLLAMQMSCTCAGNMYLTERDLNRVIKMINGLGGVLNAQVFKALEADHGLKVSAGMHDVRSYISV